MSLVTQISSALTRVGTEFKAIRTLISGSGTGNVSGLDTTSTNLVDAINEVLAAIGGGGGVTDLDGLTDVVLTAAAAGDYLRHNGTSWVDSPLLAADVASVIHSATAKTTPVGADELGLIDSAAGNALKRITYTDLSNAIAGLVVDAAPIALDTLNELAAALGDDANFASTVTTALAGKQPLDADLTAIAALVSAADKLPYATGAGAWALTTLTTFGRSLIDDADAAGARTTLSVYSQTEIGDPATDFTAVFTAALV